ncbi:MAG: hypothetical protein AAGG38_03245 [Planctomycetota bacterium]
MCPECGQPIEASLPRYRVGPAWQRRMTFRAWADTAWSVVRRPGHLFRTMQLGGSNLSARLFLLSIALLVGVGWGAFWIVGLDKGVLAGWLMGMLAAKLVLGMTYLEAAGVTFFSWRRGWRVPFGTAERVTAYASVGWVVAAVVLGGFLALADRQWIADELGVRLERWIPYYRYLLAAAGFGAAVFGFEILVWTGVRRVRFGNTSAR